MFSVGSVLRAWNMFISFSGCVNYSLDSLFRYSLIPLSGFLFSCFSAGLGLVLLVGVCGVESNSADFCNSRNRISSFISYSLSGLAIPGVVSHRGTIRAGAGAIPVTGLRWFPVQALREVAISSVEFNARFAIAPWMW